MDEKHRIDTERQDLSELMPLEIAGQRLPEKRSGATVLRWVTAGIAVGDRRVRLDAIVLGRRFFVTEASLIAFGARVAAAKRTHAARRTAPAA